MATEIMLGPWDAAKVIDEAQRKPLATAMGEEAWATVKKAAGFTPAEKPESETAPGYSIAGRVTRVVKSATGTEVVATFSVFVDGRLSTVPLVEGKATASGRWGAEDALRAVTESRVRALLGVIQAGSVKRQG
ncbi:MAG: hypothetical protein JNK87_34850 [Bryobacterales bacterium]|nr:hypothetical protein [Bryobacterales bacterium]